MDQKHRKLSDLVNQLLNANERIRAATETRRIIVEQLFELQTAKDCTPPAATMSTSCATTPAEVDAPAQHPAVQVVLDGSGISAVQACARAACPYPEGLSALHAAMQAGLVARSGKGRSSLWHSI